MATEPVVLQDARDKRLLVWGLRLLVALVFGVPALLVLDGQALIVKDFDVPGFGKWFPVGVALLQLFAVLLVLIPLSSLAGTILLVLIVCGALAIELTFAHGDIIHLILFSLPLLALISVQSGRFYRKLAESDKE